MSKILGLYPKANEIGIFIYASALFFYAVYVSAFKVEINAYLTGIFIVILILLVYRYFHEIKFGGLSLSRDVTDNDNKFEVYKSSSSTEIIKLKNEFDAFKSSSAEEIMNLKKLGFKKHKDEGNSSSENLKKDGVNDKK